MQCATRTVVRALSTTTLRRSGVSLKQDISDAKGVMPVTAGYQKVAQLQEEFSKDHNMVWQKRGARDSMPYNITILLGLTGLVLSLKVIWDMSWPKKPQ